LGEALAGEGQVFLSQMRYGHPLRQTQHDSPQVIEIASQPIHRVTEHCIVLADKAQHGLQLEPLHILAGTNREFLVEALEELRQEDAIAG
jgi:hypothetical protein